MSSAVYSAEHDDAEGLLVASIEPWLKHMRWRADFATWRERRINQECYQEQRLRQLEETAGPIDRLMILDVGAGMGGFAVAARLRGALVAACEFNPDYCRVIRLRAARYQLPLPVFNAVGEALPFADAGFNTVVCWDVVEHVRAPEEMLAEFRRVLAPRGVVLVTVINRWAWKDPHYHIRGLNWLPRRWAERLIERRGRSKAGARFADMQQLSEMHYYSYSAFARLAKTHGFSVQDLRERALRAGTLVSPKPGRRLVRAILRRLGVELFAYRLQRQWYTGMFELALTKVR